ncbi:N-terminal acetyltransferase catalytic subunit [Trichodelitschia bisporula]|uniref:N-terminal acetyltransferase catalytic subunit n=1 Tax=Trichodelitschia bisporula TaxID=703511 RepID=A0A6G1HZU0_9PEZI|nr:N-terminal acetyltransferase catalytic subunit [Trichodelitschia bisporula]
MPQPLSAKDGAAFRQVVKLYELKQHKKALKTAEQILKKNPNHGDTLAMKALTLNAQGHTDEAFSLAKLALQQDMKSHICWHVYGLLYRSTKQLDEAIKAYKFALRLEPESAQIQRDLAFLQIQMRDYNGYIESRKAILHARPALRQNWTALAVACHLAGDLSAAEHYLKTYEDTLKQPPPRTDMEHSEASLYRNVLIGEMGEVERALAHLKTISRNNLDRTAVMEMRADYLLRLDRKDEAEEAYRALIVRNNEYRLYYEKLEKVLGLDRENPDDHAELAALYTSFLEGNHRLDAARRIPLDFLRGDEFKTAADKYLRRSLAKGVPSLFPNVKALYSDDFKRTTIQSLVEGYTSETQADGEDMPQHTNGDASSKFVQSRLYFLAQHYNYFRSRNLKKATDFISQALEMDPKSPDYHMTKARILKHLGDVEQAAEVMSFARELDTKDRYINTKCAKYQLRNNDCESALKTMSLFTRNESVGGALGDLHDMQCMWYITEDGEANLRMDKLSLALKRFKCIYDIFDVWQEDQFDFHYFSIRKGQIRAYVDMMRWEDQLRSHPFFTRAALPAIKIYVMLHDNPDLSHGHLANGSIKLEGLDAAERKRALKKAKREQERLEKAEAEKREAEKKQTKKTGTGGDGEPKKEDPDPHGFQLLQTPAPLDEAVKFLTPLLEFAPKNITAQNAGFEVFIRRNKPLLAVKCLRAAKSLDPEDPVVHEQLIRFRRSLDSTSASPIPDKVAQVLKSVSQDLLPDSTSLTAFNDAFMAKHASSAPHVRSGLRARGYLDASSKERNEEELLATLDLVDLSLEDTQAGLELLGEWKSSKAVQDEYLAKAKALWPEATSFKRR